VHCHVIPRYEGARHFEDLTFPDIGWPGPPALDEAVALPDGAIDVLVADWRSRWPAA
jgi:diadenosine tetraphosphate (Ap4A) HIT family hydrolase